MYAKYHYKSCYYRYKYYILLSSFKLTRKKFRGFNGFQTHGLCVSALQLVLYPIEQWKTQRLGADQFVEFILTRERMKRGMKTML